MRILIVSFDKSLTRKIKEALKGHEVMDVKNGEEAFNLAAQHFDVIVYDAISGAISEEDINRMYEQRFREATFVVMVDDLFPISLNNLKPNKKFILNRDSAAEEIIKAIEQPTEESMEGFQPLLPEFEIEERIEMEKAPQLEELGAFELEGTIPTYYQESARPKKKIALVSFDGALIDSIKPLLPEDLEVSVVRSFRNLEEILRGQDLIVFDAISGLTAKKRLMDLSKDPILASKPFIILVDELFSIDVDDVPLDQKHIVSRGNSPERVVEKMLSIIASEEVKPLVDEEISPMQVLRELMKEEEQKPMEELLERIPLPEEEKVLELEEIMGQPEEMVIPEEREIPIIPAEEAVSSIIPEVEEIKLEGAPTGGEKEYDLSYLSIEATKLAEGIRDMIAQALKELGPTEDMVRSILKETMEERLEPILREEIRRALQSIPLENMIRELTYQALKERLKELIT